MPVSPPSHAATCREKLTPKLTPDVSDLFLSEIVANILISYTYQDSMSTTSRHRSRSNSPRRGPGRPSKGWARTNIRIDRTKLEAARRILGLETASETVDAALDAVTFREEVLRGIDRMVAHTAATGGLVADPDD